MLQRRHLQEHRPHQRRLVDLLLPDPVIFSWTLDPHSLAKDG